MKQTIASYEKNTWKEDILDYRTEKTVENLFSFMEQMSINKLALKSVG